MSFGSNKGQGIGNESPFDSPISEKRQSNAVLKVRELRKSFVQHEADLLPNPLIQ